MGDVVLRGCRWQGCHRHQAYREVSTVSRAKPCRLSSARISKSKAHEYMRGHRTESSAKSQGRSTPDEAIRMPRLSRLGSAPEYRVVLTP